MKAYLKEPDEYSSQYGKWGALNKEQRDLIKRLLKEMDNADEAIKHQFFEIERLNNIIKGAREYIHYRLDNGEDMYITQMAELLEILKCSDKVEKENDIEFDVLKALNTDLDDDVKMG
jgi:hypothetical protein